MPTGIYQRTPEMYLTRKNRVPWNKGVSFSEEAKLKMSQSHIGQTAWNKGLTGVSRCSVETKKKMSESHKGRQFSEETKRKISESNKGKKPSSEIRMKMRLAKLGKKQSPELIAKRILRGEKHYNWQGGRSFIGYSVDWTLTLKRSIRERDKYTCQKCGELQSERAFDIHHIDSNKDNCDPSNLITLCTHCHHRLHIVNITLKAKGQAE